MIVWATIGKWLTPAVIVGWIPGILSLVWQFVRWFRDSRANLKIEVQFNYGYATPDLKKWAEGSIPEGYFKVRSDVEGRVINRGSADIVLDRVVIFDQKWLHRAREIFSEQLVQHEARSTDKPNVTEHLEYPVILAPGEYYDLGWIGVDPPQLNIPNVNYKLRIVTTMGKKAAARIREWS